MGKENWASFITGGGITMEQIILACQRGDALVNPAVVIASKSSAGGIEKANRLGVPVEVVNPRDFRGEEGIIDRYSFGLAMLAVLRKYDVTVITQNGWLPYTPDNVIDAFPGMIFNQHPGPVPDFGGKDFYGKRVHAARLLYARLTDEESPWTAAMAHRVTNEFDRGPIVKAGYLAVLPNDSADSLQARLLPIEHQVQIDLLKDISAGKVRELPYTPIVKPSEQKLIDEILKVAIALHPKG